MVVYYSQILGKWILDKDCNKIGTVVDLCFQDGKRYAPITGIIYKENGSLKAIDWKCVSEIGDKPTDKYLYSIYLNKPLNKLIYKDITGGVKLNSVLDKQIIDISGARVVRVNDILLGKVKNKFAVIGVSISFEGIIRRLGLNVFGKNNSEHIIMWKDVSPLSSSSGNLQVNIQSDKINALHPAELADLIRDLSLEEKVMIFNNLSSKRAAYTILKATPDVQKKVFKTLTAKKVAEMLDVIPAHDAAAILNMMPALSNSRVLKMMKPGVSAKVQKILKYEKRTAGAYMSTNFISIPENFTVQQAIELIRKEQPKVRRIIYVYALDESEKLAGVVSLRDLILAKEEDLLSDLIIKDMITITPNTDMDVVFNLMSKYELLIIPVIDKEKRLIGVIRVHDMFDLLLPKRIRTQRLRKLRAHGTN